MVKLINKHTFVFLSQWALIDLYCFYTELRSSNHKPNPFLTQTFLQFQVVIKTYLVCLLMCFPHGGCWLLLVIEIISGFTILGDSLPVHLNFGFMFIIVLSNVLHRKKRHKIYLWKSRQEVITTFNHISFERLKFSYTVKAGIKLK